MSEFASASQVIAQSIVAAAAVISVGAAVATMSSPQGAFSMVNQFQLLILLPMLGTYIPNDIIQLLTGMSFTIFSFSFIPFGDIPFIEVILHAFEYDQDDFYFTDIGLRSGSCFVNHISLI